LGPGPVEVEPEVLGTITLSKDLLDAARARKLSASSKAITRVLETKVFPSLEAFARNQQLIGLSAKAYKAGDPVLVRLALDINSLTSEQKKLVLSELIKVKQLLQSYNDQKVFIQIVSADGKLVYTDLSDTVPAMLQPKTIFIGTPTNNLLSSALTKGLLPTEQIRMDSQDAFIYPVAASILCAIMVMRTDNLDNNNALQRLLQHLTGIHFNQKDLQDIQNVQKVDPDRYFGLAIKVTRLAIDQFLAYTNLIIKAVGAAA
jgi:hypothetical protein